MGVSPADATRPSLRALAPVDRFADFYRAEYPAAKRLAWLLTSGSADAEDVVQDAFSKMHPRFDDVEQPRAYLRVAILNGVRQQARSAGREAARLRLVAVGDDVPAPADPLLDALARLPERQRSALVLRYWADLSDDDIAAAIGVRRTTVRTLVHRALRELRKEIER